MSAVYCSLSQQQADELRAFWKTKQPLRILAVRWGCTAPYISTQAKILGLGRKRMRMFRGFRIEPQNIPETQANAYLVMEAAKRGINDQRLLALLINVIVRDKLVDAILDDAEKKAA